MAEPRSERDRACVVLEGPARILAGAGTGKTSVIVERVRRLIEGGAEPESILVMTFTERAASEIRERIQAATGHDLPGAGTFHAMALRWLREDPRSGLPAHMRLLVGAERWISLRELMWDLALPVFTEQERPDDVVPDLLKLQERLKQELVQLPDLARWAARQRDPERRQLNIGAARLFAAHADLCRRQALADFDDLLLRAVRLLEAEPDARAGLRRRYRWVLVDEYQDCNAAQERLIELLGAPAGNVCVVGDDDQSIYRFRGASRASMERFLQIFPPAQTHTLTVNWRSQVHVVAAARSVIERDRGRIAKDLRPDPDREEGPRVRLARCPDRASEQRTIIERVRELAGEGVPLEQMAVLCRTHAIALELLKAFAAANIPAVHWASQGLYQRPEVRDLIAYLRLVHDPGDLAALARMLARPPLRLDLEEAMALIRAAARSEDEPVGPLPRLMTWPPTAEWATIVSELSLRATELGVNELLYELMERTGHLDAILPEESAERERVIANSVRFVELVDEYCERRADHSLGVYLEHLDLVLRSGMDEAVARVEEAQPAVRLMSMHQAKGLEFEAVFLPALVEGRLPLPHRPDPLELPVELVPAAPAGREDHLAEERRLLYVAMTRARRWLQLSWAERYEGTRRWRPSRFLEDLDAGAVEEVPFLPAAPMRVVSLPDPAQMGPPPSLSFSAISTYRDCPRQFWYRYRLRLPSLPRVEAQLGTIVHETLLTAGKLRRQGRRLDEELLRQLYDESWESVVLAEPRRRQVMEALGWSLLVRFWGAGGLDAAPLFLERSFAVDMDGWELRGVIDRVDEVGEGEDRRWRIMDYKTGKALPASRLRRDLQLALYALGADAGLGLSPVDLEIVYLRDGHGVTLEASPELLEEARQVGGDVAEGVRMGWFDPRPERRRCSLCSYRLTCEAAL
jgi:DNA helicase-2/ATP-dependent DNA helicase PcrA